MYRSLGHNCEFTATAEVSFGTIEHFSSNTMMFIFCNNYQYLKDFRESLRNIFGCMYYCYLAALQMLQGFCIGKPGRSALNE